MKGVISFCLFGNDPLYCQGAIRNAELAKKLYPDWMMAVYVGDGVSTEITTKLSSLGVLLDKKGNLNPMLERFRVAGFAAQFTHFLIRDTDSRLNSREKMAVDEWLESGMDFHMIADHPHHTMPMHGGLWGGKTGILNMGKLLDSWNGNKKAGSRDAIYNNDQMFLNAMVWPFVKNRILRHDSCTRKFHPYARPFPIEGDRFVGERFTADDQPFPGDWEMRINNKYE